MKTTKGLNSLIPSDSNSPPPYTTPAAYPVQTTAEQGFIDFRLTQPTPSTQSLALSVPSSSDLPYPPYTITLDSGADIITPSFLSRPDVTISHSRYLAPIFAEGRFQKYRSGDTITYPETRLRPKDGDVGTTVEATLPLLKQNIKCQSLAERRYTLLLDGWECCWRPPREDPHHMLELLRVTADGDGTEVIAKVVVKSWHQTPSGEEALAVVRVREDVCNDPGEGSGRMVMDQILATAVVLVNRTRRRSASLNAMQTQVNVNSNYRGRAAKG